MPKQRQRTLLEFLGSSSPTGFSSPPKRMRPHIETESDDSASDPGRIKFERDVPQVGQDDAGDDDGHLAPCIAAHIQGASKDASLLNSSSRSASSEMEDVSRKPSLVRHKRILITSDESDDQIVTKKRRLVKGRRPNSHLEENEDENLVDEVDEDRILKSRFRARQKRNDFARNLERLQRRRRGEASPSEDEGSDEDASESSSHGTSPQVFHGARPMVNGEDDTAEDVSSDEDNADFIVQDDDGGEIPELPTMYSMGTYQDLSHHFKVICQLFVHLAVKKPHKRRSFMEAEMKKNYFSVPLAIARRKLSAMKDSLVTSSIWKPDFKNPLESLPEFRLEHLDFSVPLCDACRLGRRVATLRGVTGGHKYDRLTFELLEKGIEKGGDRSDNVEWNLGRFCAARAQVFHLFSHWEYILYHALCEEVERLQAASSSSNDPESRVFIPFTQGPPPPDDLNDADGIMDWLDGRGIINSQWLRMKGMMDRALKLEGGKEAEGDIEVL